MARVDRLVDMKEYAVLDMSIQKMYQWRLLQLNELIMKYDLGGQLSYKEMKRLLYYVVFFSDLMRKDLLQTDNLTREILTAIDLYRVDKEAFTETVAHNIIVFWERSGKLVKAEIYPDIKAYEVSRKERYAEGLREMKIEVVPKLEHLIYIGKQILDIGSRLGILNLIVTRKPKFVVYPEVNELLRQTLKEEAEKEEGGGEE